MIAAQRQEYVLSGLLNHLIMQPGEYEDTRRAEVLILMSKTKDSVLLPDDLAARDLCLSREGLHNFYGQSILILYLVECLRGPVCPPAGLQLTQ